jgi:NADPH:quinone reductase-like Zn-dependent oxidoreductase
VEISSRLPLSGAAEAHTILEGRRATGKIVLKPWPAK